MTLEEEAKMYAEENVNFGGIHETDIDGAREYAYKDFKSGANSNYVKRLVIEGKIETIVQLLGSDNPIYMQGLAQLKELNEQLKELQ